MATLTQKQEEKLIKIQNALKRGDLGIIALFLELDNRLDKEIPELTEVINRMRGDKGDDGDDYIITDEDKKDILSDLIDLVDQKAIAKKVVDLVSLKEIAKLVPQPQKGKDYFTKEERKDFIDEIIKKVKVPKDGKDADEEKIAKKTAKLLKKQVDNLMPEPLTPFDIRNSLESIPEGKEQLAFGSIRESKDILKDIKELKDRPATIIEPVGMGGGTNVSVSEDGVLRHQDIKSINFGSGFDVTKGVNGVTVTLDPAEDPINLTLQEVTDNGSTTTNSITALSFIKSGGTSSQFLKADGSVDSSTYLTTIPTHTGEVTGNTALTLNKTAISNRTDTTIVATDILLFGDTSDSDNLKKGAVQDILDLAPDLSGYVPYTGATTNLNLGANNLYTTGSVGIGTTPSAKLHSQNTTEQLRLGYDASNYASFSTNSSGQLNMETVGNKIYTLGQIGIGTIPTNPLTIRSAVGANLAATTSNIVLQDSSTAATGAGGAFILYGPYTGTLNTLAAGVKALKANNTAGNWDFDMGFYARQNGSSNLTRYAILKGATGNFGIGTDSPAYKLEVQGTGLATDGILVSTSDFTSIPNPGSVLQTVSLNPRGFNMTTDNATLSTSFQPGLGIGVAVNRIAPALALKNGATYSALLIEQGRFGLGTSAPATPLDIRGTIRAGSDQGSSFETRIDLKGNQYLEGGTNVASGGIEINGVQSGVGYGLYGSMMFYGGANTDATRGWAWNANGQLTEATNLSGSGAQMVLNKGGYVGIGTDSPSYPLQVKGGISGLEKSADPAEPAEGEYVIWMSDGTGKGDDGDVMIASRAGGTTKYGTLFDHSAGSAW